MPFNITVKAIQERLIQQGYKPGTADGYMGAKTKGAIRAFQIDKGLDVDGVVGKETSFKLFNEIDADQLKLSSEVLIPWYGRAVHILNKGMVEIPGSKSNPEILKMANTLNLDEYTNDDIPWCGLFQAFVIKEGVPDEPIPAYPLLARNWDNFGRLCLPVVGAVLRFWRVSKVSGLGHVGMYVGEDDYAYHVIGGNQSNSVNITRILKSRLVCSRWPTTFPLVHRTVIMDSNGKVSVNEA